MTWDDSSMLCLPMDSRAAEGHFLRMEHKLPTPSAPEIPANLQSRASGKLQHEIWKYRQSTSEAQAGKLLLCYKTP